MPEIDIHALAERYQSLPVHTVREFARKMLALKGGGEAPST